MAMFAKRHYEAIALVMQSARPNPDCAVAHQWEETRNGLMDLFARDNPQFDCARFERACEPGANVRKRT